MRRILTCQAFGDLYRQEIGIETKKSRIALQGSWLYDLFTPGEKVVIEIEKEARRITISPLIEHRCRLCNNELVLKRTNSTWLDNQVSENRVDVFYCRNCHKEVGIEPE